MSKIIQEIDIDCPNCNNEITISVNKINHSVKCPYCKEKFKVLDDGIIDALNDVDNQIDDLLNNLF